MKKFFFFLAALQFSLYAQLSFNPIYNLSNTPSATSDYHSTYSRGNDFYVAWGDNGAVKLRHSSDQGLSWSSNRTLNGSGTYPVIAGEGNTLVVFYHSLGTGVFYQRSTDKGVNWSSPALISLHTSAITPQIESGGSNILYAVWEERPGTNYELYFSKSTDLGQSWSAPINISNTPTTSRWMQIKANSNGNVYCTWIETTTYPFSDIYFIKSTNYGSTWSTPVNITNDNRPQNRIYMDLGYGHNNQDIIYMACDDISSYPVYNYDDIFLMKSTDSGSSWSTAVNITNNAGHSSTPSLVVIEPLVFFTWSDNTDSAPLYDNSDIYFKLSLDGGVSWQDSVRLCSNPESSSRPRICWGLDGPLSSPWLDLSVVWYDYSTGDAEILARNGTYLIVPVELVSFKAEAFESSVQLKWITASEINNKGFEIERKTRGAENFTMISFVPGKGTTAEVNNYTYDDLNLPAETYIYRLKQIDYDGTVSYSNEVEAVIGKSDFYLSQNYPNPFNPLTLIKYSIHEFTRVELKVYDMIGNEMAVLVAEDKSPGFYKVQFDGESLSSGVYFYKLQAGEKVMVRKLLLLK